jgi:thiamine-phosphate pyrophosphorylase
MLIVISSPEPVVREAQYINQLFEAGLQRLHLRKPGIPIGDIRKLLRAIQPVYYERIALHQHHTLAVEFGIQRLHFMETMRERTNEEMWQEFVAAGYRLSTSIHSVTAYGALSPLFQYVFLGPVFGSISKAGYKAGDSMRQLPAIANRSIPLVAIGGVSSSNYRLAMEQGFNGVAVLGAIWQSDQPVQAFKNLTDSYVQ